MMMASKARNHSDAPKVNNKEKNEGIGDSKSDEQKVH